MNSLITLIDLSISEWAILASIAFFAGLVRGFSGFALSAIVMASALAVLPPIALIPICWWLEMTASALMMRGGWADADRTITTGLVVGATAGMPIGLALTAAVSVELSALIALSIILILAALLLANVRLPGLASTPGIYGTGLVAGIAGGLAAVSGLVVALYVLAVDAPARQMRGNLVLFLLFGGVTALASMLWFGVMDTTATARGLALAPTAAFGVFLGQRLFTPRFTPYYRPFCLTLLMVLAGAALIRQST